MATLCPECLQIPIDDLLTETGEIENPGCATCDGRGLVGDPDACSLDIPLCMGLAVSNDRWACTCDSGLMAAAGRMEDDRSRKRIRYLLREVDDRLSGYESLIYSLMTEQDGHLAGMMAAQEAVRQLGPAMRSRRAALRAGKGEYHVGVLAGHGMGIREAMAAMQSTLRKLIRQHRTEAGLPAPPSDIACTGTAHAAIREQLSLF